MPADPMRSFRMSRDWQSDAACRGTDTSLFYLDDGERGPRARRHEQQAKQVCAGCPVTQQCLAEALARDEQWGVWGGLTPQERGALVRRAEATASISGRDRAVSLELLVRLHRDVLVRPSTAWPDAGLAAVSDGSRSPRSGTAG